MWILVLTFFLLHEYVPRYPIGPIVSPLKIVYFESKSTAPLNQENRCQLACSRKAEVAYSTDKCPVQFRDWPVDESIRRLLDVYLFYMVFAWDHKGI